MIYDNKKDLLSLIRYYLARLTDSKITQPYGESP